MLVFCLKKNSGFFSEIFFMLNYYLICNKNNIPFSINSLEWLFKYEKGWHDYFDSLDELSYNKDFYYNFLKSKIWPLDYIEDIVRCGEENGMRISILPRFSPSIITERITSANVYSLLQSIGMRIARFR